MREEKTVTIKRSRLILIILLLLLLIVGGVFAGLYWSGRFGGGAPGVSDTGAPDIDPNAAVYTGVQPEDKGGSGTGIKIPGYPSITLPSDTTEVSVALLNPEGNPCYFAFELVLKDSGETLYTSKLVPPGQAITRITLARALPAGEYDAVIKISTASLEDGVTAMNGANVETVLIVR